MEDEAVGIEIPVGNNGSCEVVYGDEYERLDSRYEEGSELEEQERERIFGTAARVLGQCPSPYGPPAHRTGLALGKVQSGKTMSYIALSALAFDSGYRVVVALVGRTKALAEQNKARFDRELIGIRPSPRIATFHNPDTHHETEIQAVLESDNLVLITLLKTQVRLGKVAEIFFLCGPQPLPGPHNRRRGRPGIAQHEETQGGAVRRPRAYTAVARSPSAPCVCRLHCDAPSEHTDRHHRRALAGVLRAGGAGQGLHWRCHLFRA